MKYTIEKLLSLQETQRLKYLFFWGNQPAKDGSITASCFSQWWKATFVVDDIQYLTAEHWMMAEKARLFNDSKMLEKILNCDQPAEAKKLGRNVHRFDAAVWDTAKYDIVVKGNIHKFKQNEDLKDYLLTTGDRILVEASPVDAIWGIGMAADHLDVENPACWRGENLLGFALMEVRDVLS